MYIIYYLTLSVNTEGYGVVWSGGSMYFRCGYLDHLDNSGGGERRLLQKY